MTVNRKLYLIGSFVLCFLVLVSCKKKEEPKKEPKIINQKTTTIINFDSLLKCSEYSFQENYYITADYGCIYNPQNGNSFGNLIFYLIPKDANHVENTNINDLDSKTLKKDFRIYAYLIPSSDLNYNPKGDSPYYQKEKFKEQLYYYDAFSNQWVLTDEIQINSYSENEKEQNWRESFIASQSNKSKESNQKELSKEYYAFETIPVDLKSKKYKVIVLEKNSEKNNKSGTHFAMPILIMENKGNEYIEIYRNDNLVFPYNDNCPADGYESCVTKSNYFTLQQSTCLDFLFVTSYTTFRIDENKNEIVLHKYGEEYSDRSNPDKVIPSKTWSTKDFGIIKFENLKEDDLLKLRRSNPK